MRREGYLGLCNRAKCTCRGSCVLLPWHFPGDGQAPLACLSRVPPVQCGAAILLKGSRDELLRFVFNVYNQHERNGKLRFEDLVTAFSYLNFHRNFSMQHCQKVITGLFQVADARRSDYVRGYCFPCVCAPCLLSMGSPGLVTPGSLHLRCPFVSSAPADVCV